MSHWRKHEANVLSDIDMGMLEKACTDVGVTMDHTIKDIQNSWGHEKVDAGLRKNGEKLPLGFNFTTTNGKTKVQLTGDFYCTGLSESSFMDELAHHYQRYNATDKIEQYGYTIESGSMNEETGNYEIFAYQYA